MKTDLTVKISHICEDEGWRIQTNEEHCLGVAHLAGVFAAEFGMEAWGRLIGLLHDRGKESNGFQAYIRRNSGYDTAAYSSDSKDHSYVGAVLSHRLPMDKQLCWLSNAIAGHHRGLYDIDELELALTRSLPPEVSQELPDVKLAMPPFKLLPADASHLARMLFSCLVDADWLDTERFMDPESASARGRFASLEELDRRLTAFRETLKELPASPLNALRCEIQAKCEEAARLEPGFFDLTVPTGGGKTIASVIWALRHALAYGKKRIIIAIPFTSIIVQTAAKLREIFGDENVIEHHSAMNESAADERSQLARENWDAPIIVTTNVQLFESMFSNRPSACRKLHSIVNSVVILDEAQSLPLTFLQPIVNGMAAYKKLFGTSFLFCTASQPVLDGERKGSNAAIYKGLDPKQIRPIIGEGMQLHDKLRRVKISIDETPQTYASLAENLLRHRRVLCVVNSRRHAIELYNELSKDAETPVYHLSRSMCSAHILEKIEEIRRRLADPEQTVRVISTQLIEAGVDIDFPVVYRQLSGLDSILQAAGRCNREGKAKEGQAVVFTFADDRQIGYIRFAADTMKDMISLYPDADWFAPETMRRYYEKLYARTPAFDKEGISELLDSPTRCQFEEAARKFHLIDENGINIIVNFANAEELITRLKKYGPTRSLSRQLGRYSVTVPQHVYKELAKAGLVEEPYPGFLFIPFAGQYDPAIGLKTTNAFEEQTLII